MSYIHTATLTIVANEGYTTYQNARDAVVTTLVKNAVAAAMRKMAAAPAQSEGGDYKDRAATLSGLIWDEIVPYDRVTKKALFDVMAPANLLNGYSCPRAFWVGLDKWT